MKLEKWIPLSGLACIRIIRKRQSFYSLIGWVLLQLSAFQAAAQFTKLQDLGDTQNGMNPYGALVTDGSYFYGMTSSGGANNLGTIYKVKPDGSGYTKLLDFDGTNGQSPYGALLYDSKNQTLYGMANGGGANGSGLIFKIQSDGTGFTDLFDFDYTNTGGVPFGSLISDGNYLYGMTRYGGKGSAGTAFKVQLDGTGFTVLVDFAFTIGSNPTGSLLFDNPTSPNILYGMTPGGGTSGAGTVFSLKTDGTYTILYHLAAGGISNPYGSLVTDGTYLYGMTYTGGKNGSGAIFKATTDGNSLTSIYDFDYSTTGAYPKGDLLLDPSKKILYGTTTQSSALPQQGNVFQVGVDGSNFTILTKLDVGSANYGNEGPLLQIGTTLYGVRSGYYTNYSGLGYLGSIYKVNTDATGYSSIYSFEATGNSPSGSLTSDGNYLYGMTYQGGKYNYGVLFRMKPDGSSYSKLLDFDGINTGGYPKGSLIYDGTYMYGMTLEGGLKDNGAIFKIKADGTGYVKLYDFDGTITDGLGGGSYPSGSLVLSNTTLFGMTRGGGNNGYGTIFKINTDGSGFKKLLDFDGLTEGGNPYGSLLLETSTNFLYGMTSTGGSNDYGTTFRIQTDGSGFQDLLDFDYDTGASPQGDLYFDGADLYALTQSGGANGYGTIIKVKKDGSGYLKLFDFDGTASGSYPVGSLISDDGKVLYGMTNNGGVIGGGTAFKINSDGTNYSKILDFNDGTYPQGALYSDGKFLYGMTNSGGSNSLGTVFKFTKSVFVSLTTFSPSSGPAGTLVTISGNNFDPVAANNIVMFNKVVAKVITSTLTSLVVVVPAGATSGPISVAVNTMATSLNDFTVTTNTSMFDGAIQSCNTQFTEPGGESDVVETFYPSNPATDKIMVSFSKFSAGGDQLNVYDGPSTSSPLIASFNDSNDATDIVATNSTGALTFEYSWGDSFGATWIAHVTCQSTTPIITITTQPSDFIACLGDAATFTAAAAGATNITYQWQYSPDGKVAFTDLVNGTNYSNVTTSTLTVNTSGNFGIGRYRCKIGGDLAATVFTADEGLFINPLPSAPTTQGGSACPSNTITLSASGGTNGKYRWYTSATGGNAIQGAVNSTFTTPVLTVTTTYYVSINNGTCESARIAVAATINDCNPPVIAPANLSTLIGGTITIDLNLLITSSNLDKSSIQIVGILASGAKASIDANGILTIDYAGKAFAGIEKIAIKACDFNGQCSTQDLTIDVVGDIVVYNGISPNGANPKLILQYIEVLPDTKANTVYIFDRWENLVWRGNNYDNDGVVFTGQSDGGSELPSGVYFYKIDFASGKKSKTGFISLRKQ